MHAIGTHFLYEYIMHREVRVNWNFCPLRFGIRTPTPLTLLPEAWSHIYCRAPSNLLVHFLRSPLSERLPTIQLEVSQSAVVKPQSSHHPLFLSPNSRVTVMSYQDHHKLQQPTMSCTAIGTNTGSSLVPSSRWYR